MLWRCHDCKEWFTNPSRHMTYRGSYWEPEEWDDLCPYCDSDNIEELRRCDDCDDVAEDGSDYCAKHRPGETA